MTKTISFNVLVEKIQDRVFMAHCLELDLIATSVDCEDVQGKMTKMIGRIMDFAAKNNRLPDIFRPASPEVWEKYRSAKHPLEQSQRAVGKNDRGFSILQSAYAT